VNTGVSLDVDMEEVCEETSANEAICLNKTEKGQRSPTNSVLIIFEREELPEYTTIDFTQYHARVHIPALVSCVKCNAFGLVVKHCRGKETCSK